MKRHIAAAALGLAATVMFTGCVPVTYTRSVTVHKDASGNITGTDETETISEPHSEGQKMKELKPENPNFKYLK